MDDIIRQSAGAVDFFLREAIKSIDGSLGGDYARKNPALVGAFINAAAVVYGAVPDGEANGAELTD